MICALIIGRKGSQGFPGKNVYKVMGRPLSVYPILAARNAVFVDDVYVSTDDERIASIADENSARVIERPKELASKEALGEDAYIHGYNVIKQDAIKQGKVIELMVLLMCNAPTISAEIIDEGITHLRENPEYDSAVTVSCYNMWSPLRARKIGDDGLLHPFVPFETFGNVEKLTCDRDSQGDVWFADMGVSIVRPACLERIHDGLLPQKWMGRKIYPLKQWGGCDVDYEWQIPGVEFWLKEHGFTETTTPYKRET